MTTGKKRYPKSPKTRMMDFFIKHGIPFLNARRDAEITGTILDGNEVAVYGILFVQAIEAEEGKPTRGLDGKLEGDFPFDYFLPDGRAEKAWPKDSGAVALFIEGQEILRGLVNQAVNPDPDPSLILENFITFPRFNAGLAERINDACGLFDCKVSFSHDVEGRVVPFQRLFLRGMLPGFGKSIKGAKYGDGEYSRLMIEERRALALLVGVAVSALEGGTSAENPDTPIRTFSPGAGWIGLCSRCGKAFEKANARQVWCGEQCANAERQRRFQRK